MNIGILTFHWGTNYGGVLQAYCLQEYLISLGHSVEVINYKPRQYDISFTQLLFNPKNWKHFVKKYISIKKEKQLEVFRKKFLFRTIRFSSSIEMQGKLNKYDVLISGSDQVLNPGFTCHGENGGASNVYWLSVGRENVLRIGYAISFGCTVYPKDAEELASQWVNNFDYIGTRENTGLEILNQLRYSGEKKLVPDPTLLIGAALFKKIGVDVNESRGNYTCIYLLRHEKIIKGDVRYIDEKHRPLSMEDWLKTIVNSKLLITNSYHGMIMAILARVPFVVMLESGYAQGMNDRFYTLLNKLELEDRIVDFTENSFDKISSKSIDWKNVDKHIDVFRKEGFSFLDKINYESALV